MTQCTHKKQRFIESKRRRSLEPLEVNSLEASASLEEEILEALLMESEESMPTDGTSAARVPLEKRQPPYTPLALLVLADDWDGLLPRKNHVTMGAKRRTSARAEVPCIVHCA